MIVVTEFSKVVTLEGFRICDRRIDGDGNQHLTMKRSSTLTRMIYAHMWKEIAEMGRADIPKIVQGIERDHCIFVEQLRAVVGDGAERLAMYFPCAPDHLVGKESIFLTSGSYMVRPFRHIMQRMEKGFDGYAQEMRAIRRYNRSAVWRAIAEVRYRAAKRLGDKCE